MANKIETLAKIQEVGIVAVVRATSIEQAAKITDACIARRSSRNRAYIYSSSCRQAY